MVWTHTRPPVYRGNYLAQPASKPPLDLDRRGSQHPVTVSKSEPQSTATSASCPRRTCVVLAASTRQRPVLATRRVSITSKETRTTASVCVEGCMASRLLGSQLPLQVSLPSYSLSPWLFQLPLRFVLPLQLAAEARASVLRLTPAWLSSPLNYWSRNPPCRAGRASQPAWVGSSHRHDSTRPLGAMVSAALPGFGPTRLCTIWHPRPVPPLLGILGHTAAM